MIEVKNICKKFGNQKVLDGISATFEKGKINCIIGRSGSGKTVLLKCIIGLETPDCGSVFYDGREFSNANIKIKREIRKEIGMVFQSGALFDSMTILENVMFPLNMFTDLPYKQKLEKAIYSLNRVGLFNVEKKYPAELSGGMQKRAAIARAIVNNPKYLFCDEPNSGLDPITSQTIDELIKDIATEYKTTTIINTHDMNTVLTLADKIILLADGKKVWDGNSEQIFKCPNDELAVFLEKFFIFTKKIQNEKFGDSH